jgi:hemerythrin superfamily protein
MGTKPQGDVVAYLKGQHEQIKALFGKVLNARGTERASAFYELRRLMAIHETAEEEVVHPAARRALMSVGDSIVSARLREEHKAKVALVELESLDTASAAFETKLRALQTDVLAHAESEEREEFSKLGEALTSKHLERMRTVAEFAEMMAPTRPHPGVESAAANMLLGPFAAMVDRARDLLTGKS